MSVGRNPGTGRWEADCIFCDWRRDFPSMTAADRGNDLHLLVGCSGLSREERTMLRDHARK